MRTLVSYTILTIFGVILIAMSTLGLFTTRIASAECTETGSGQYCLLEPLPIGQGQVYDKYDPKVTSAADYINLAIKVFISIIGVLGVIMIVLGGVQYMTTDAVSKKEGGKEMISNAIFGLILALASWLILNTINPHLIEIRIDPPKGAAVVTTGTMDFSSSESKDSGFKMNGTLTAPTPSAGIATFVSTYLANGYSLTKVVVDTANKKSTWYATKGSDTKELQTPVTGFGANGIANAGTGVVGDKKTPKGTSTTTYVKKATSMDKAVLSNDGYNLGAVFMNTGITSSDGKDRGIGFHGNAKNTPASTAGCIRMYNDDLVALSPYFKGGINVVIQ